MNVSSPGGLHNERYAPVSEFGGGLPPKPPAEPQPGDQCADTDGMAKEHDQLREAAELRPPPEHAGKPLHWLQLGADWPWAWEWLPGIPPSWASIASGAPCMMSSVEAAGAGFRYLGPAEWRPPITRTVKDLGGSPNAPDFTGLNGPDMLDALGADAWKWAQAFVQHAAKLGDGYVCADTMIGWFANAIEHSHAIRSRASERRIAELEAENARLRAQVDLLTDANSALGATNERLSDEIERAGRVTQQPNPADAGARDALRVAVTGPPRAGEFVTCENGHLICEVLEDINIGDMDWTGKLGHWRIGPDHVPAVGGPAKACPCGAAWTWSPANQLHINGRGWC